MSGFAKIVDVPAKPECGCTVFDACCLYHGQRIYLESTGNAARDASLKKHLAADVATRSFLFSEPLS